MAMITNYLHPLGAHPPSSSYEVFVSTSFLGWWVSGVLFGANSEVLAQALQSNPQMPGGHLVVVVVVGFRLGSFHCDFLEEMMIDPPLIPKTDIVTIRK